MLYYRIKIFNKKRSNLINEILDTKLSLIFLNKFQQF